MDGGLTIYYYFILSLNQILLKIKIWHDKVEWLQTPIRQLIPKTPA